MLVYRQNQVYSAEKSDLLSSLNNWVVHFHGHMCKKLEM
jgi:hypothetical protein